MNRRLYHTSIILVLLAFVPGCGSDTYPPVSGTVTIDGKPVPLVTVVFGPVGTPAQPVPGPYSIGVTDSQGAFTLRTRHGDRGAVPGDHRVGIEYGDVDKLDDLKLQLGQADEQLKSELQKQIDEHKIFLKTRPKVPRNTTYEFNVPKAGTSTADFELNAGSSN